MFWNCKIRKLKTIYLLIIFYILLSNLAYISSIYAEKDKPKCKYWKASISEHLSEGRVYEKSGGWIPWIPLLSWKSYYTYGTDIYLSDDRSSVVILHEIADDPGNYYLGKCPQ
jgi:hypothetical protein